MTRALERSLTTFRSDLKRHHLFLDIEAKIKNPAGFRSRPRSETLLSAYVILSCGCFERFLQESFYNAADDLRRRIVSASDPRIIKVDKFHWQNMHGFIRWAAYVKNIDKTILMSKITSFSGAISAGTIFPESFQYTDANPKTDTIKNMFSRFGIDEAMLKISANYRDERHRSFSPSLIETTLNNFVNRRHQAAHNGRIEGVSRNDAQDDHVFINALAEAVSKVLKSHVSSIV